MSERKEFTEIPDGELERGLRDRLASGRWHLLFGYGPGTDEEIYDAACRLYADDSAERFRLIFDSSDDNALSGENRRLVIFVAEYDLFTETELMERLGDCEEFRFVSCEDLRSDNILLPMQLDIAPARAYALADWYHSRIAGENGRAA